MNNSNNYAVPGLNSDSDNLFDFEAASSNTPWADTSNNLAQHTQTVQAEEAIHIMPLTKSEREAILAARASNAQNCHQAYSLAQPELHTNISGFEEPGAYRACFNFNGADILLPTNLNDFDVLDYGNTPPNASDGFGTSAQPQFEEPARIFGALTDCAPQTTDQSG